MTKPATRVEAALSELCLRYGYCLPSYEMEPLLTDPPDDPEAFVDAVLAAEGLDPSLLNKHARAE